MVSDWIVLRDELVYLSSVPIVCQRRLVSRHWLATDYELTLVEIYLCATFCRRQPQKAEISRVTPPMTRASI